MKKRTDELGFELAQDPNAREFIQKNQDELITESINEYIQKLIEQKHLTRAELIRRTNLDRTYGYQLLKGMRKLNRNHLLQIAFGLQLTLEETQKLLKTAREAVLYERDQRDVFIISALYNKYSIDMCDQMLHENGQDTLQTLPKES